MVAWSTNLGNYSITLAELWDVYWGLSIIRNRGFRNVWLELDPSYVYHFISHGVVDTHAAAPLVAAIRNMILEGDWNEEVSLVYREANVCANKLAKHGHFLLVGMVVFDVLPQVISH